VVVDKVRVDAFVPGDALNLPTLDSDEGATLRVDDALSPISAERFGDSVDPWRMRGGDASAAVPEGDFDCGDLKDDKDDSSSMSVDERDGERPLFGCDFILTFR
jgi:hypothetical protein